MSENNTISMRLAFFLSALSLIVVPFHGVLVASQVFLALEIIGLLILLIVLWSGSYRGESYGVVLWFILVSLGLACLYVVPIPRGLIAPFFDLNGLPGRELYSEVEQWLSAHGEGADYTLSLIPYESVLALLAVIPPLALFFSAISLSEIQLRNLVYLVLLIAGIQSALGLIQYASGNPVFYFGLSPSGGRSAQGTYINRDHFSALLEMTLPIAIGLMLYSIGRSSYSRRSEQVRFFNQLLIFVFLALIIFLAAVFARSRTGVFLILVAVLLSSFVFARHVGGKQAVGLTSVFATLAVGLAAAIGLIPVLNRFVSKNPIEDERFRIFQHSIEGIKSFFPFGSGPGTFSEVYRVFQPIEQRGFINNAHNDYIELVFETGVLGLFIIIGFLFLYIFAWFKLSGQVWNRMHFIKVGSGIGILLFLLHLLTEFLLHEPMNTLIFALLVGVFFRSSNAGAVRFPEK